MDRFISLTEKGANPMVPSDEGVMIEQFDCLAMGDPESGVTTTFNVEFSEDGRTAVTKHFGDSEQMQRYISNVIKLSKLAELMTYDSLRYTSTE
jgi:hypothetical protein